MIPGYQPKTIHLRCAANHNNFDHVITIEQQPLDCTDSIAQVLDQTTPAPFTDTYAYANPGGRVYPFSTFFVDQNVVYCQHSCVHSYLHVLHDGAVTIYNAACGASGVVPANTSFLSISQATDLMTISAVTNEPTGYTSTSCMQCSTQALSSLCISADYDPNVEPACMTASNGDTYAVIGVTQDLATDDLAVIGGITSRQDCIDQCSAYVPALISDPLCLSALWLPGTSDFRLKSRKYEDSLTFNSYGVGAAGNPLTDPCILAKISSGQV